MQDIIYGSQQSRTKSCMKPKSMVQRCKHISSTFLSRKTFKFWSNYWNVYSWSKSGLIGSATCLKDISSVLQLCYLHKSLNILSGLQSKQIAIQPPSTKANLRFTEPKPTSATSTHCCSHLEQTLNKAASKKTASR